MPNLCFFWGGGDISIVNLKIAQKRRTLNFTSITDHSRIKGNRLTGTCNTVHTKDLSPQEQLNPEGAGWERGWAVPGLWRGLASCKTLGSRRVYWHKGTRQG
jgi:hypothetical protein